MISTTDEGSLGYGKGNLLRVANVHVYIVLMGC